jgi:hypothetical protein
MATYSGNSIDDGPETGIGVSNPAYGQRELVPFYTEGSATVETFGTHTSQVPITGEPENSWNGNILGEYGYLDFYFRIHMQYAILGLGAIVTDSTIPFYVFNAWLEERTLVDFELNTTDPGLTLDAPHGAPPVVYAPLEVKTYNVEVDDQGSATVEGTVSFEFDTQTLSMEITGIRVLSWRWSPNWDGGMRERLDWLSDVERSYSGRELRRQIRAWPTQTLEFTFDLDDKQMRIAESMLYNWGARLWAVPFWPDVQHLEAVLPIGSTVIPVDTTTRTYTVGELIILVARDDSDNEVLTVSDFDDTSVTLLQPTSIEWPVGTFVYPGKLCRLTDGANLARFIRDHAYGTAIFKSYKGVTYTAATETTYRGYPVLLVEPNQKPDPSTGYLRQIETIDFQTGLSDIDDQSLLPDQLTSHNRTMVNREELAEFRAYLYARAGRAKGVWVPSFSEDLILAAPVTSIATEMVFEYSGVKHFTEGGVHRRDIRIELHNGTVLYRRVSDPDSVVENVTERMALDIPLGVAIAVADVKIISWMALSRFDSDAIEISWDAPNSAECLTVYRSYKNDV